MAKKLSTEEILKRARAQDSGQSEQPAEEPAPESEGAAEASESAEQASEETGPSEESQQPAAPSTPSTPKKTPQSTKDILAAARAQAAGGGSGQESSKASVAAEKKGGGESGEKPSEAASEAPGKTPKSTKDILAAARAQAAGEGQAPAAEKPATGEKPRAPAKPKEKASPKAPASAKPGAERPSVQEMLRAVREGKKPESAEAPRKPAGPKTPAKPAAAKKKPPAQEKVTRRSVLLLPLALLGSWFAAAWVFFTLGSAIFLLACARFMMPNVLIEPPSKFKVGPPSDFPPGTVSTNFKSQFGVWLVHASYGGRNLIYALASICTHLGCTPNWLEGEQKFKCPCHGSGFYITGINFEGPAPRPLERYGIRLAPDGMLEVDKSVTFQQEMGQWEDPTSYVEVA